ncbi:MAG TPA: response regulator [Urbifossiella sp.]|jgi:putative nucleotidyltransferase with HDIG domain|nr:response regulator [Urbifossiella sp.]
MIRRVLFVDDEPNVLNGLRRCLRPFRGEWDMAFAQGGAEALAALAAAPADVVVTDMRMPGMDGDALLARVRADYPHAVRMVLTGQCTREAVLRLVPLAHGVFTKPCDPAELTAAIRRACSLRDLLRSPDLLALVGKLGGLPTPPALYTRILAELERPDGSLTEVGRVVAEDVGLSAKVMQVANSSLLGLRRPAATPAQAVQAIGMETTKALALMSEVLSRYDAAALRPFSIDDLWDHSRAVAGLAWRIARAELSPAAAAEARLAGLLHDIGRLALASQLPEAYKAVLGRTAADGAGVCAAERAVLGATHAEVGAYLLGLWGLPGPVVEAVARHHDPAGGVAGGIGPLAAVTAAEAILAPAEGGLTYDECLGRLGLGDRAGRWAGFRAAAGPDGGD